MSIPFLSASLGRLRYEARAVRSRRLNPCWNVVQPAWERSLVLLILTITVAAAGETMPATHTVDIKCAFERFNGKPGPLARVFRRNLIRRKLGAHGGVPNEASRGDSCTSELAPLHRRDGCPEPKPRPPLAAKHGASTSDFWAAQPEQRASVGPRPPACLRPTAGGRRPRQARLRRGAPRGSDRGRCPPRWGGGGA